MIDRDICKIASKYHSYKHQKGLIIWTHLVSMLFCHLSSMDSVLMSAMVYVTLWEI
ncbi:DUF4372 domain-containing protein [Sphingobacterium faecium]|uniref:DUF4372 domain-containing protein n=1 Tax=Sphingobacterium faecium TaxID=34087 RepID=UPI000B9AA20F|nr:DUF4372 domain-containing protein [Sphingobacterium sp.]